MGTPSAGQAGKDSWYRSRSHQLQLAAGRVPLGHGLARALAWFGLVWGLALMDKLVNLKATRWMMSW